MKALVLGATGFIGGHIARAALAADWEVRGLSRDPSRQGLLEGLAVEWVQGDLDQPQGLANAFSDVAVVFHAAGYYPSDSQDVPSQVAHSMQQTSNVLGLMRQGGCEQLIYTSSYTTMVQPGSNSDVLVDESAVYPAGWLDRSAYYECKLAMEQVLLDPMNSDISSVIMNPTLVLGPGDTLEGTGAIINVLARGWGVASIQANMNVVDVRDVALGHILAAERGKAGERYLLGGHNLTLRQLMTLVASRMGVRSPRINIPMGLVDILVWMEDNLSGMNVSANHLRALKYGPNFSNQKAREALGLRFRPLEVTIKDMLESFHARGYL